MIPKWAHVPIIPKSEVKMPFDILDQYKLPKALLPPDGIPFPNK